MFFEHSAVEKPMQTRVALLFAIAFALIAFALRFAPVGPNVAAMGALCLFAGCFLKGWQAVALGLGAMFASDLVGHWLQIPDMGFYGMLMLFNYAAYLAMIGIGMAFRRAPRWGLIFSGGLGSAAFFLVSNFGAWLDPRMGYEASWNGLMTSYALGLPFHRTTFLTDVVFSAVFFAVYLYQPFFQTRSSLEGERVRNQ
jgi:hypothetical protein